jgi:adenylate cyclase
MLRSRRYLTLRVTLLSLLVTLLLATAASLGSVAFISTRDSIQDLQERYFRVVSVAVTREMQTFLEPGLPILSEARLQAQRERLPVDDPEQLADYLVERLRFQPTLAWFSYSDEATGRFAGAWRREDGAIVLNRSAPDEDGGRPHEVEVLPSGEQVPFDRELRGGYDPRTRDWYRSAADAGTLVWTEPFEFNEGRMGITAALALREPDTGRLRGVFTADFFLDDISRFLLDLTSGRNVRIIVLSRSGKAVASSLPTTADKVDAILASGIAAMPESLSTLPVGQPLLVAFDHDGVRYDAAFQVLHVTGGLEWATGVLVPEEEFLAVVYENLRFAVGIGLLALMLALAFGSLLAHRIAMPLGAIARDLQQVGHFKLSSEPSPTSHIREIAVVSDSVDRMKASLRSFSRYVPTELVQQVLVSGREAQLGGEARTLTIYFSDIEGFTQIAEKMQPAELVQCLAEYLQEMTGTIAANHGTVDKFMGDGILALFNAPTDVPDHAARACRAALQSQERLRELKTEWGDAGKPTFRARIGLHMGEVLVGNIGTPDRFAYTVIGDTVNLASRLEALNKVYGTAILASQDVREAAGDAFEWRTLDRVAVAGRSGGTLVNELLGRVGEVPAETCQARDLYEEALVAYFERRFGAAAAGFRAAASARPGDRAAEIMASRAISLEAYPVPLDWDGLYLAASK